MYSIVEPRLKTLARLGRSDVSLEGDDVMEGGVTSTVGSSSPGGSGVVCAHPARKALLQHRDYGLRDGFRSVSFEESSELDTFSRAGCGLERVGEDGSLDGESNKASVTMDTISTMTLTEFKSLLTSALSVPEEEEQQRQLRQQPPQQQNAHGGDRSAPGSGRHQLDWDNPRDRARTARDSISSSVTTRRGGASGSTPVSGGAGRRNLPHSPMDERARSVPSTPCTDRPKTPVALRRNANHGGSATVISESTSASRPKTPTSGISRPKTPTSGVGGYRPKTPNGMDREYKKENASEYVLSRPKTPSQIKRDAVAKVAGAISNWVDSRPEMDSPAAGSTYRPKTPTRPKTPVSSRNFGSSRKMDSRNEYDDDDDDDDNSEIAGVLANPHIQSFAASTLRERPATPSRIPKPCFTPRPVTPKVPCSSTPEVNSSLSNLTPSSAPMPHSDAILSSGQLKATAVTCSVAPNSRPGIMSRSNSNPSSVRSLEHSSTSPASSCGDDKTFQATVHTQPGSHSRSVGVVSRKQPLASGVNGAGYTINNSNNSNNNTNNNNDHGSDVGSISGKSYRDLYAARRAVTPGPTPSAQRGHPARSVTPGPRETWTSGSAASAKSSDRLDGVGGGAKPNKSALRRGSLTNWSQSAAAAAQDEGPRPVLTRPPPMRRASSATNLNEQPMMLTNEITFSDDEEINELVKNAVELQQTAGSGGKRFRSASVDARKMARQPRKEEEVLMVRRDGTGNHGVQVVKRNEVRYDSTSRPAVMKRPPSRGNSTDRPQPTTSVSTGGSSSNSNNTTTTGATRARSQAPEPHMAKSRMTSAAIKNKQATPNPSSPSTPSLSLSLSKPTGQKALSRTDAWVDSTLADSKTKPTPRGKRPAAGTRRGFGAEIPASELVPRPLEEIQAILPETKNGLVHVDPGTLEAPPGDPEMFRKMEKLFEKYREMELKASVNETPGGSGGAATMKSSHSLDKTGETLSVKAESQKSATASSSRSTLSVASTKTSSDSRASSSGGASSNASPSERTVQSSHSVVSGRSSVPADDSRFRRSASVPGSFQTQQQLSVKSNSSSPCTPGPNYLHNGTASDLNGDSGSDSAASSSSRVTSLKDIDTEMAKNPAALMSKIKEILRVRPRKDENSVVPTRIPAPASLSKYKRSKSVSNLYYDRCGTGAGGGGGGAAGGGGGDGGRGRHPELSIRPCDSRDVSSSSGYSRVTSNNNSNKNNNRGPGDSNGNHSLRNGRPQLSKANSTSSGNIAYTEFVFTDKLARHDNNDDDDDDDAVPELSRTWSMQSDSSDSVHRAETPVPKLATPLTTGRSTVMTRRGDRMGRGLSQEKENNLSNSQSSLSVLSTTEDEADFV